MKVSTSTSSLVYKYGIEKALNIYSDAGFEALDYSLTVDGPDSDVYHKYDEQQFAEYYTGIKKMIHKNGMEAYQSHAVFPLKIYNDERDEHLLKVAIRSIYANAYLECPYIIIHPAMHASFIYGNNYEECRRSNFEFYGKLVPALKDTGVQIAIENMYAADPETKKFIPTTCSKVEWMIDFIDGLNDIHGNHFCACLDTGHAAISGSGATDMLLKLGSRTKTLHVQDDDGLSDKHTVPGLGKLDWAKFIQGLRDVNYSGTFNFEADNFFNLWTKDCYGESVLRAAAKTMYAIGRSFADQVTGNE